MTLTKHKLTRSQSSVSDHAKVKGMLVPVKEIIDNTNPKHILNYTLSLRTFLKSLSDLSTQLEKAKNCTDNVLDFVQMLREIYLNLKKRSIKTKIHL